MTLCRHRSTRYEPHIRVTRKRRGSATGTGCSSWERLREREAGNDSEPVERCDLARGLSPLSIYDEV